MIHFPFSTWGTPRQLKILICENEQKPELHPEPEPWRKRFPEPESHSWKPRFSELEPEAFSWKKELRSRSCVIFTTAWQPRCSVLWFPHIECFQSCVSWIPFRISCYVSHAVVSGAYPFVAGIPPSLAWSKSNTTVGWVWRCHQRSLLFSLASGPQP